MNKKLLPVYSFAAIALFSVSLSAVASQYNMSLQDKTATGYNGAIASPYAVEVDRAGQMDTKESPGMVPEAR
jgi:hypothetical protein